VTGVNVSKVKVKRRLPSPKDLAQLLRFRKFIFSSQKRRLSKALTIYDLRVIAKRRTPQAPFDYTDGGADSESSLDRARAAYEKLEFQPNILRNVKNVDLSVKMLGKVMNMPLGIAPTGFTRMMQTEGEYAGACAAADAGIAIPRPAWWINFLTTDPLKFASLDSWNGTVAELLDSMFDPTVTYEDLKWIRQQWTGNLVVKGIQNVGDAVASIEAGADAIILSNHGGRQLDRAPVPLHLLPEVIKEVGNKAEVHVDTGIMHGQDVVAALASGAKFTWIGRAYLYGLMAGGKSGVDKTLEIFRTQITRTMKLLGVSSVAELNPDHVRFIARYADN